MANLLCPNCQKALSVPETNAGQLMRCPLCGEAFQVPAAPAFQNAPAAGVSEPTSAPESYAALAPEEMDQARFTVPDLPTGASAAETLTLNCPRCSSPLSVRGSMTGQLMQCPVCAARIIAGRRGEIVEGVAGLAPEPASSLAETEQASIQPESPLFQDAEAEARARAFREAEQGSDFSTLEGSETAQDSAWLEFARDLQRQATEEILGRIVPEMLEDFKRGRDAAILQVAGVSEEDKREAFHELSSLAQSELEQQQLLEQEELYAAAYEEHARDLPDPGDLGLPEPEEQVPLWELMAEDLLSPEEKEQAWAATLPEATLVEQWPMATLFDEETPVKDDGLPEGHFPYPPGSLERFERERQQAGEGPLGLPETGDLLIPEEEAPAPEPERYLLEDETRPAREHEGRYLLEGEEILTPEEEAERAQQERQRAREEARRQQELAGLQERAGGLESSLEAAGEARERRNQQRMRSAQSRLFRRIPGSGMVGSAMSLGQDLGEALGFLGQEQESEGERRMADTLDQIRQLIEDAVRDMTNDGADIAQRNFGDPEGGRSRDQQKGHERQGEPATLREERTRNLNQILSSLRPGVQVPSAEEARAGAGGAAGGAAGGGRGGGSPWIRAIRAAVGL